MPIKSYPILAGSKRIRTPAKPCLLPPAPSNMATFTVGPYYNDRNGIEGQPFLFYSFAMEKTKLAAFCEPSRSQWKIMNRQPKASLGHCSSERNTPGWLTTTSPGPLPGSYGALKIRNGGKKMRFGQVGFPFRKSNWSAGILQQVILGATVV